MEGNRKQTLYAARYSNCYASSSVLLQTTKSLRKKEKEASRRVMQKKWRRQDSNAACLHTERVRK